MKVLIKWRKQHFLLVDVVLVTLAVAIAVGLVRNYIRTENLSSLLDGIRTTLYGTGSSGCIALLGFVIASATIADAVMQDAKWGDFRKTRAYSEVQNIYFDTMRWLGLSALLFLVFLIIDTDRHPQLLCEAISAWLVCVIAFRIYRSVNALETLLRMNSFKEK